MTADSDRTSALASALTTWPGACLAVLAACALVMVVWIASTFFRSRPDAAVPAAPERRDPLDVAFSELLHELVELSTVGGPVNRPGPGTA